MKSLLRGERVPEIFLRWDLSDSWEYFGSPASVTGFENLSDQNSLPVLNIRFSFLDFAKADVDLGPDVAAFTGSEGHRHSLSVNKYERDPRLRTACLKHHGSKCKVCDFDFEKIYGELGRDFCHVHHIVPLSELGVERLVSPITDLIPVCANCHSMLHRRTPALLPNELIDLIKIGQAKL